MNRFFNSFVFLNLTQFFAALNDNLFKLLLIFFLIAYKGESYSNSILALAGAIYVIPFIVFASLAGTFADRFSKRTIIYFTRGFEILTTLLGVLSFAFKSIWGGYTTLFLMGTHSALFSPCKYGIIPELVSKEKVSHCNGVMSATTYLAIITGTFFASFLTEVSHSNFTLASSFCFLIALIGASCSLGIKKTFPQAKDKRISAHFVAVILNTLKRASARRYLLTAIIFEAYFLFIGSFTQLNIIPFTIQSLHLNEVQGGYLFLMTAIGIGIGSFLAGRLSGKEVELGFVPLAASGVTVCFVSLYFFDAHLYGAIVFMVLIGLFGGFYIVPLDSFIQVASPQEDRGQNVAAANFLSFLGVIVASGLIALFGNVFHLLASEGFLMIGGFTFLMALFLFLLYADQVLRLFAATVVKLFWKIRVVGRHRALTSPPTLLIAPRSEWTDTLIVMAALPRLIRYIIPVDEQRKKYSFYYRHLWLLPLDIEHFFPIGPKMLEEIKKELEAGRSVCVMQPIDVPPKTMKDWETYLEKCILQLDVPVIPIHISRNDHKAPIKVFYGESQKISKSSD